MLLSWKLIIPIPWTKVLTVEVWTLLIWEKNLTFPYFHFCISPLVEAPFNPWLGTITRRDIKGTKLYQNVYICKIYVRITWQELSPMTVQYTGHVIQTQACDNNTALPLEGVLVMWYGRISYIYTFRYNLDTVLCQFLETGRSDRTLIRIVQLQKLSGFIQYPLSFFPLPSL